jgi:hypothetical protein
MNLNPGRITHFARTNPRNDRRVFGIKQSDRLSHMYVIGKTGTGKSTLLERLILSDIEAGERLVLVDVARGLGCADGAYLSEPLLALLDQPQATLPDILRLFSDKPFRNEVVRNIKNPQVRAFREHDYEKYTDRMRADGIAPIQNKIGAFLANPKLYRILTAPEKPINVRRMTDEGKILLVNLAKGQIGEDASSLLDGLLVTTIGLAAFSRQETDAANRRPFYCYLDEFQNFTTLPMANMFSELRKYRVGMIVVHQYLYQLDPAVQYAVLGNTGDSHFLPPRTEGCKLHRPRVPGEVHTTRSDESPQLPHLSQAHDRRHALDPLQRRNYRAGNLSRSLAPPKVHPPPRSASDSGRSATPCLSCGQGVSLGRDRGPPP